MLCLKPADEELDLVLMAEVGRCKDLSNCDKDQTIASRQLDPCMAKTAQVRKTLFQFGVKFYFIKLLKVFFLH